MKMSHLAASFSFLVTSVLSTAAWACPAARGECGSCTGLGEYMAAIGVGLLLGIGSVGLEGFFRRR
jgi:hypothetical protein